MALLRTTVRTSRKYGRSACPLRHISSVIPSSWYSCCKHTNVVTRSFSIDVMRSYVSSSSCDAGYAPTSNVPGITQLLSGVGPQYSPKVISESDANGLN